MSSSAAVVVVPKTKRHLALEEKKLSSMEENLARVTVISKIIKSYNVSLSKYRELQTKCDAKSNILQDLKRNLDLNPNSRELREKYEHRKQFVYFLNKEKKLQYAVCSYKKKIFDKKEFENAILNYDYDLALAMENEKHAEKTRIKTNALITKKKNFDIKSFDRLPEEVVRYISEFIPYEVLLDMREKQYGAFPSLFKNKVLHAYIQDLEYWEYPLSITRIRLPAMKMFTQYKQEFPFFQRTAEYFRRVAATRGGAYKLNERINLLYMMLKRENPKRAYSMYNYFLMKMRKETMKPSKK